MRYQAKLVTIGAFSRPNFEAISSSYCSWPWRDLPRLLQHLLPHQVPNLRIQTVPTFLYLSISSSLLRHRQAPSIPLPMSLLQVLQQFRSPSHLFIRLLLPLPILSLNTSRSHNMHTILIFTAEFWFCSIFAMV